MLSRLSRATVVLALAALCAACTERERPARERAWLPDSSLPRAWLFAWHELLASDPEAQAAFYVDVVGWRARRDDAGRVTLVGDFGDVGGIKPLSSAERARGVVPQWVGRVEVEDVDAAVARARLHGGRVVLEPEEQAELRLAIMQDSAGVSVEIAKSHAPCALPEPGLVSEFAWNELATPDGPGAADFYGHLLGWKVTQVLPVGATGEYRIVGRGQVAAAGIFSDPSVHAAGWTAYVRVLDLDDALSRAQRHGARILFGPQEAAEERFVVLTDPEGAVFGLRASTKP